MKKIIVCFVAITLSFLVISSATAVVTSSSTTVRNVLEQKQSYEKPLCFGLLTEILS